MLPENLQQTTRPETSNSTNDMSEFDFTNKPFTYTNTSSSSPFTRTDYMTSDNNGENAFSRTDTANTTTNGNAGNSMRIERPLSPVTQKNVLETLNFDKTIPIGSTNNQKAIIKKERQAHARQVVQEQAFLRCLSTVADGAAFEDQWKAQSNEMREKIANEEAEKKQQQRELVKQSQALLKKQMEDARIAAQKQKLDRKFAEYKFYIGDDNSGYMEDILCRNKLKKLGNNIIGSLESQIEENRLRKEQMKNQKREEEREYLDHVAMEMDMKNVADHISHLEKQQQLLSAWERDGHVRNLKRLQTNGVNSIKQYITTNVDDVGIGYDSRK